MVNGLTALVSSFPLRALAELEGFDEHTRTVDRARCGFVAGAEDGEGGSGEDAFE